MSNKEESLLEKAMRQAKEASAATQPAAPLSAAGPGVALGVGAAAGLAQGLAPGTFNYHTVRPAAAQAFVDALQALSDNDTRLQTSGRPDQLTIQFMQRLPTGNWASAVTVTLMHAADQITVTSSGQNMAALATAAGALGGEAIGVVSDLLKGPRGVGQALERMSRSAGKVTGAATDLNLSGQVRSIVERLGGALEEEWSQAQRTKREAEERERAATVCPYCNTPYPSTEVVSCPICNAPRSR